MAAADETSERGSSVHRLAEQLLHAPSPAQPAAADGSPAELASIRPPTGWWRRALRLALSLLLAYHLLAVLARLLPEPGLSERVRRGVRRGLHGERYLRLSSNVQGWKMFAPNPHRRNVHMRVFMEDEDGQRWNLRHDLRTRRRFPYLFYDRFGKINRRLTQDARLYTAYAAWVCRDWELLRLRGDARPPARRVHFVLVSNRIPPPERAIATNGYHPRQLRNRTKHVIAYRCAELPHGQVPNLLRVRYGLPRRTARGGPGDRFIDVPLETWWTRAHGEGRGPRARMPRGPRDSELRDSGSTSRGSAPPPPEEAR